MCDKSVLVGVILPRRNPVAVRGWETRNGGVVWWGLGITLVTSRNPTHALEVDGWKLMTGEDIESQIATDMDNVLWLIK
jgi:hypothetical protein